MADWKQDARQFQPELTALLDTAGDHLQLRAPAVGLWRHAPPTGSVIMPGMIVGELEILGVLHRLRAPAKAHGLVLGEVRSERLGRRPVGYRDVLLTLDPHASAVSSEMAAAEAAAAGTTSGLVYRSPSSGRFYAKPGPDKPPFVTAGDTIKTGQVVGLLEIMKTFHRLNYGGEGLPERAHVKVVIPADGDDLDSGDPIFEVEAAD